VAPMAMAAAIALDPACDAVIISVVIPARVGTTVVATVSAAIV
jgi:hypothetical protein